MQVLHRMLASPSVHTLVLERVAERDVVGAVSESAARTVEVAKVIPQERVTGHIVEQTANVPVHDCTTRERTVPMS